MLVRRAGQRKGHVLTDRRAVVWSRDSRKRRRGEKWGALGKKGTPRRGNGWRPWPRRRCTSPVGCRVEETPRRARRVDRYLPIRTFFSIASKLFGKRHRDEDVIASYGVPCTCTSRSHKVTLLAAAAVDIAVDIHLLPSFLPSLP